MNQQADKHNDAHQIAEILDRLARIMLVEGHASGLKPVQWEALRYLARANRFSSTPGALTRFLSATKGTVSQTLIALERKGLIEKYPDPGDRRSVRLQLTHTGKEYLAEDPLHALREAAAVLSAPAQASLNHNLRDLLARRLAINQGRPFGLCRQCRYFKNNKEAAAPYHCTLLNLPLYDADADKICIEQEAIV